MIETMGKPYKDIDEAVKHILDDVQNRIDEAYQRGFDDGKKAFDLLDAERDSEYQRGLDDAWEAARRVAFNPHMGGLSVEDLEKAFDCLVPQQVFKNYTAKQTIEKLKAYEEKQKADDEIKVGDEVEDHTDSLHKKAAVWSIKGDVLRVIAVGGGTWMLRKNNAVRTGRHFDIDKILEEMKA